MFGSKLISYSWIVLSYFLKYIYFTFRQFNKIKQNLDLNMWKDRWGFRFELGKSAFLNSGCRVTNCLITVNNSLNASQQVWCFCYSFTNTVQPLVSQGSPTRSNVRHVYDREFTCQISTNLKFFSIGPWPTEQVLRFS